MVERESSEVLLDDVVKGFDDLIGRFGEHAVASGDEVYTQPCVWLSMHLICMRAAGWDTDFDTLAAVSGASALFAYEPRTFMPKYANLYVGMADRIAEATGFGWERVRFDGAEGAWTVLKGSIGSGRPVKGWHYENVLFAGYRDAAKPEDRQVFTIADGPDTFAKWWTWNEFAEWVKEWSHGEFGRHTERAPAKGEREVALRVLGDLLAWSKEPPEAVREAFPKATFGLAGIEKYAADCANTEEFDDWSACHDINPQWTVRRSTALYLEELAKGAAFPDEANEHLVAAARQYHAAYAAWQEFYRQVGHDAPKDAGRTLERRLAAAKAVREALNHENAGIEELQQALAGLEEVE